MRRTTGRALLLTLALALLGGAATVSAADDDYGQPTPAQDSAEGVTLLATPGIWPPGAPALPRDVIPVLVTVENQGAQAIEVDLSDFVALDRRGRRHAPLWPETLMGDVRDPRATDEGRLALATDATDEEAWLLTFSADAGAVLAKGKAKAKVKSTKSRSVKGAPVQRARKVSGPRVSSPRRSSPRVSSPRRSSPRVTSPRVTGPAVRPRIDVPQQRVRPRYRPAAPSHIIRHGAVDNGRHGSRPPGHSGRRGGRGGGRGYHWDHRYLHGHYHPYWSVHIGVPLGWWGCHPWWGCFHREYHVVHEYVYSDVDGGTVEEVEVDVLQLALKEGVLAPERKVSGFLFFSRNVLQRGGALQWEVWAEDAEASLALLALELPRP